MHAINFTIQVFSDDLFLLLRGGLCERGKQLLGWVAVCCNILLGWGYLQG